MDMIRAAVDTLDAQPNTCDVTVTIRVRADRETDALAAVVDIIAQALEGQ